MSRSKPPLPVHRGCVVQATEDSPHRLCDPSPRTRAGLLAHRAPPLQLPGLMHVATHPAQRRRQIPSPPSPLFASLPRPVQRISTEASFRRWEKSTHLGDHLLGRPGPAPRKATTPLPHSHSPAQAPALWPRPLISSFQVRSTWSRTTAWRGLAKTPKSPQPSWFLQPPCFCPSAAP